MKKQAATKQPTILEELEAHPLMQSHRLVSTKNVDYNNLTAFEAVSMAAVLILAVTAGVAQAANLG